MGRPLGASEYDYAWRGTHPPCNETGVCMCAIYCSGDNRGIFSVLRSFRYVEQFPHLLCCCRNGSHSREESVLRMFDEISFEDISNHEKMILEERHLLRQGSGSSISEHEWEDKIRSGFGDLEGVPLEFPGWRPCALPGLVSSLARAVTFADRIGVFDLYFSEEEQKRNVCRYVNRQ